MMCGPVGWLEREADLFEEPRVPGWFAESLLPPAPLPHWARKVYGIVDDDEDEDED